MENQGAEYHRHHRVHVRVGRHQRQRGRVQQPGVRGEGDQRAEDDEVLSTRTPVRITQDTSGVPGAAEKGDRFGWSLSAGDTNGDGYADVAVGASSEALGGKTAAGTVTVLRGSATGLTGTGSKSFSQDTAGVPGTAESHDQFGGSVHLTDSNADGRAELIAGAFAENDGAGSVWLFKAGTSGITATGSTTFGSTSLGGPSGLTYFGDRFAN